MTPQRATERPRILFVTPLYHPYLGGVERHVHEVAGRLAAWGCRVGVLTTDPGGTLPPVEDDAGVRIRRVAALPRGRDYYFAPQIYREIVSGRRAWDLVHVQSYHTFVAPLAMVGANRAGIPYVVTFHGGGHSSRVRHRLRHAQWTMLGPLIRRAARLIAVAGFEVPLYSAAFRVPVERFTVIPNGVDFARGTPAAATERPLIASVGRLERYKGHQRILAALPLILAEEPDARLWIAGSGPYEAELRAQAARLGVERRVDIRAVPAENRDGMAAELGRAALVVLLSEYETQPLAVLEAAALGKPALVADTSGMSELARQGLAVAIPPDSGPREVAAAVLEQLEAPHVPPSYTLPTWDDCARGLLDVYSRVLVDGR